MGSDLNRKEIDQYELARLLGFPDGSRVLSILRTPRMGGEPGEVYFVANVSTPNTLHDQPSVYGDAEPCKECGACFRCAVGRHSECHGCRCACQSWEDPRPGQVKCGGPCQPDRVDASPVAVAS